MRGKFLLIAIIASLAAGFAAGFFTPRHNESCNESFRFINEALRCEFTRVIKKHGYADLKEKVEQFIREKTDSGEVASVSIYFRDLENGPTLGINEHEKFVPASLLKVPLMLTFLRLAEERPSVLEEKLGFVVEGKDPAVQQGVAPAETLQENTPYTVDDLLRRMIEYSDNRSADVLLNYLNQLFPREDKRRETMEELGLITPQTRVDESITVKNYASIFTLLYNVSFLETREMSEKALVLLAQSDFDQGIVTGVPEGTPVAHKFGERFDLPGGLRQLHDCGIVYFPENPYLLCIMTRGRDYIDMAQVIQDISKMVYEEVDSRRL